MNKNELEKLFEEISLKEMKGGKAFQIRAYVEEIKRQLADFKNTVVNVLTNLQEEATNMNESFAAKKIAKIQTFFEDMYIGHEFKMVNWLLSEIVNEVNKGVHK